MTDSPTPTSGPADAAAIPATAAGADDASTTMKAVAVLPPKADSIHLRAVPRPTVDDIPNGRGALVRVIRVGLDGTDREIWEGLYGAPPDGENFLIVGHENLGRVVEVGPNVPSWLKPGLLVASTVRRPGHSIYDMIGMQDMTTDDVYYERGINKRHGYMSEYYVEDATYIVPLPDSLASVGVLIEPLTIAEKGIRQAFEIQRRLRVWRPQRAAVLGAGTIGLLVALACRLRGLDVAVYSRRPGPYLNSDLIEALGAAYVSSSTVSLEQLAAAHGPFDLMFDATGYSPLAFEAAAILGKNGVFVLASVTGGDATATLPTDRINQGFVLGNKVMVGTVNASRDDFVTGVEDMLRAESFYPGWLDRLLTTPIRGLDDPQAMYRELSSDKGAIKVYVQVAEA